MKDSADKNTIDAFQNAPLGWGGRRPGSGRKNTGAVKKSKVIRVPEHLLPAVQAVLDGDGWLQLERVAISQVVEEWRAAAAGKSDQPRWQNVCRLLAELQEAIDSIPR